MRDVYNMLKNENLREQNQNTTYCYAIKSSAATSNFRNLSYEPYKEKFLA